jgi:hypothetical protein
MVFGTTVPMVGVASTGVIPLLSGGSWPAGPTFTSSLASVGVAALSVRLYWTRSRWSWAWGLGMPVVTAVVCALVAVTTGILLMYACAEYHTTAACAPGQR